MITMLTKTVIFIATAVILFGTCQAVPWTAAVQQYSHADMYYEARADQIDDGIAYLRKKPQDPLGPPYFGPKTNGGHCTRVSCEYASGIYVCNDNDFGVQVPLGKVADYVQAVIDDGGEKCHFWDHNYGGLGILKEVIWGQAFDLNGWNVIVGMWHLDDKC